MKKNLILCVTVLLFSFLLLGKVYGAERLSDDERAQFSLNEANGKKPILKAVQATEMRASTNARPVFIGNNTFYGNAN